MKIWNNESINERSSENMKKKIIYLIGIIGILVIIFILGLHFYNNRNIALDSNQELWTIYDAYMKNIEMNMEEITSPNEYFDWWELKEFDIKDSYYKQFLNLLVADIRMYYIYSTDSEMMYTHIKILKQYRDKEKIPIRELEILQKALYVQELWKDYDVFWISEDEELRAYVLEKFEAIISEKPIGLFEKKDLTYEEILSRKIIELSYYSNLSDFVRAEYYRFK